MKMRLSVLALAFGVTVFLFPAYHAQGNHENDPGMHLTPAGDTAVYGGRLAPGVVINEAGGAKEWRVGAMTAAAQLYVPSAVNDWNSTLQTAPNSLSTSKFVFHWQSSFDFNPGAVNIQVQVIADPNALQTQCGTAPACNTTGILGGTIWVDSDADYDNDNNGTYETHITRSAAMMDSLLTHELGHSLELADHYNTITKACGGYASVMDCSNESNLVPTTHDENDFYAGYKPKDAPSSPTMSIGSGSQVTYGWNSAESERHNISDYWIQQLSDRNGSVVQEFVGNAQVETGAIVSSKALTIGSGGGTASRFCIHTTGFSSAGYQGLVPFGIYAAYGCASRSVSPYSTSYVATSEVSGSSILIRVRNSSASARYFQVVGPGIENLGSCSNTPYHSMSASGGQSTCTISYSTAAAFNQISVFIWSASTGGTLIAAIALDTDAG